MAFTVPFSSSLPSTPDSRLRRFNGNSRLVNVPNEESTTPAGPPPSSAPSFTPAGQPPSTMFGSSQFGTGLSRSRFEKSAQSSSKAFGSLKSSSTKELPSVPPPRTKNGTPARPANGRRFAVPTSSLSQPSVSPSIVKHTFSFADDQRNYSEDGYEDDEPLNDSIMSQNEPGKPRFQGFTSPQPTNGQSIFQSSTLSRKLAKSLRSSRGNATARKLPHSTRPSQLPSKGDESILLTIARDVVKRLQPAQLDESDDIILGTEDIMSQMYDVMDNDRFSGIEHGGILAAKSSDLLRLWEQRSSAKIEDFGGVREALEIASLWLNLHHPPLSRSSSMAIQQFNANLHAVEGSNPSHQPLPKVLLDWLDKYHTSTEETLRPIRTTRPNCTAHELFWDSVNALAIRGKFSDIIRLFSIADFKYAASALDDGQDQPGYHGAELQSVQGAVNRARQLLEACPAVRHNDWETDSQEWETYRARVAAELDQLVDAAEGADAEADEFADSFGGDSFGVTRQSSGSIRQRARQAMSRIPWHVYESLKVLHKILLGSSTEILAIAQDYLEASLALTIWWDGVEDDKIQNWSLSVSRQAALTGDPAQGLASGFLASDSPYLRRVKASFLYATDPNLEGSFAIDTLKTDEVGLTTVLQNDVEGMLGIIRSMSIVICSALAEIGVLGGWLLRPPNDTPGLDKDDLIVLSYGQPSNPLSKDEILLQYVESLFTRDDLQTGQEHKEGWELAIAVATRIDDRQKAHDTIETLLEQLHLVSQDRMDKLLTLCAELDLKEHAMQVSERFADHLIANTSLYGPALLSYARAHSIPKLTHLLSLLTSYSLVQSAAYPPTSYLDAALSSLLRHPRTLLSNVHATTPYGAGILQFHISGYATLKKFYDLRDRDSEEARKLRPLARRREAAKCLVAVINSAADSIYGGLYDASRRSAIEVDGLLTLFGEATALFSSSAGGGNGRNDGKRQPRVFTIPQLYDLLAAIEDLATVSERVFAACEECLQATLRSYRGSKPPSPHAMLKKSVSNGLSNASNFNFSLIGSEMVGSGNAGKSAENSSGVLVRKESDGGNSSAGDVEGMEMEVEVERGWDWRELFTAGGGAKDQNSFSFSGREVLDRLRVMVINELADAEVEGDGDGEMDG